MTGQNGGISLSEVLASRRSLHLPPAPSFEIIDRTIERVIERFGAPAQIAEKDPERMISEMLVRIRDWTWQKVPMSLIARIGRLVFAAPWRDRPDCDPIRTFLIDEVAVSTRSGFLNPLVQTYIATFSAQSAACRRLGQALERARERLGAQWRALLTEVPEFFDAARAAQALARKMVQMEDIWRGLRALGLRAPHGPGLMDAAHLAYLEQIGPKLTDRAEIERLLAWLRPAGQAPRPTGAAEAITALLRPWTGKAVPEDLRALICERLIEIYGDPRPVPNATWLAVGEDNLALFRRWLTKAELTFFIGVVNATQNSDMWPPRRDFWELLYRQGRIAEAWVAFPKPARDYARRNLQLWGQANERRFGEQIAGGSRSNTSLLIMRIGDKIVVDGCHSYKTHIFDVKDPQAPKLYQRKYDCEDIRLRSNLSRAHNPIPNWSDWVLRNI
ncbi:EH signature domain-containing protein [Rhodobacter capsulatus]|uniref:EH signature domain-containing protein n=1 Tax=Rhodobacter capsulatus TaxID=1061 RepID=UPI0003D30E88|nr:EH signature domain-containing protein [Rhodobacter capsulatus]ETD86702.1 hypothetical protein U716_02480 [Rhodobacter capsulatus B6]